MKAMLKKALSLLLAAISVLAVVIPAINVLADESVAIPTVYIAGQGYSLFSEEHNERSETVYPLSGFSVDYALGVIDELNPVFLKALITNDYTDYCDVIYNAVEPLYAKIRLDNNGENANGTGIGWTWSRNTLTPYKPNGNYGLFDYNFKYDWRLDPYDTAEILDRFIKDVMAVTRAPKVNIVSRCLGCNIAMTYIAKYGNDFVNKCVLYSSVIEGTAVCDRTFNGEIHIDSDGTERFVYDMLDRGILEDELLTQFVETSVALLNKTYGLNLASAFVDHIYKKVKSNIVPRLLLATYATFPSYWSMVGDSFESAKDNVFGNNKAQYAGLIEKINRYHYNVQVKARDILTEAKKNTDIAVIVKYGYQLTPIVPETDEITDGVVEVTPASFGAMTSKVDKTFSKKYLAAAKENGTDKYISPDKQVDASTALLPDSTWFIKRLGHKVFPESVNVLIEQFLDFDGQMTVNDDARFPQYMVYNGDNDTLIPMTEDNNDVTGWESDNIFVLLYTFFKLLPTVIETYLIPLFESGTTALRI